MGNLDAIRDWGYAPDYVEAMWLMLQSDTPDDFVVATGTDYSVKDFLELAFSHVGLEWQKYVEFDDRLLRPAEVDVLIGDSTKAREALNWEPRVMTPELAKIMVDADTEALKVSGTPWIDHPYAAS